MKLFRAFFIQKQIVPAVRDGMVWLMTATLSTEASGKLRMNLDSFATKRKIIIIEIKLVLTNNLKVEFNLITLI